MGFRTATTGRQVISYAPICSTATDVHDVVPSRDVPMANATKCDMERLVRTARPTIWSENVTWAAMLDVKNWSEPKRLSERIRWSDDLVPLKSSGVYRLIALKNPNDFFPSPLQRVCGIDKSGTLYVGAAEKGNLLSRLQYRTRSTLSQPLRSLFPPDKLAVQWEITGESEAFRREGILLRTYENEFGEFPPANRRGGRDGDAAQPDAHPDTSSGYFQRF
jgi:hypothetical protein